MNLQMLVILIMLVGVFLFSILNWTAISAPGTVNLGVGTLDLPFGVFLLFVVVLFGVVSAIVSILHQSGDRVAEWRQGRELQRAQKLALGQEESRVGELHEYVEAQLGKIIEKIDAIEKGLERIDLKKLIESEVEGIEDKIEEAGDELKSEIKKSR